MVLSAEQTDRLWALHRASGPERAIKAAAYDGTRTWVDPDGYRLSDRLWRGRARYRENVDRLIHDAIRDGTSAKDLAKQLDAYVRPAQRTGRGPIAGPRGGGGSASYPARRLARTEITRAHGVTTMKATAAIPGAKVAWRVSGGHPKPDRCDQNAHAGPYPPDGVPTYPDHPQCLCTLSTVIDRTDDEIVAALRQEYGLGPTPVGPGFLPASEWQTTDDATAWGEHHLPGVPIEIAGMDIRTARDTFAQLEVLVKDYPEAARSMAAIRMENGAGEPWIASVRTRDSRLRFNAEYYRDGQYDALRAMNRRSKTEGWTINDADGSARSTMTHEFGHVLDNYMSKTDRMLTPVISAHGTEFVSSLWTEALGSRKATTTLSRYAVTNRAENFAEAFAALYHDPTKLRLAYVRHVRKLLDEIGSPSAWTSRVDARMFRELSEEEKAAHRAWVDATRRRVGLTPIYE